MRFQDETIFIICDDDKLTRKLGEDYGTVILYFPSETYYICISDEYLELDILAHEITHAELHTRLFAEAQKRIPTWFDEGIALQNDYAEKDIIPRVRPAFMKHKRQAYSACRKSSAVPGNDTAPVIESRYYFSGKLCERKISFLT